MSLAPWLAPVAHQLMNVSSAAQGHAFLLVAPFDIGQTQLVRSVALHWLHSQQLEHVDLYQLACAEDKQSIGIEQIRHLIAWTQQTAHGQAGRVVMIDALEQLTANAANSLLKTLEEPPEGVRFLMLTSRLGRLLPTLISRCQRILLPMPSKHQAIAWLQANTHAIDDTHLQLALQLHGDAPQAAQQWLLSGGLSEWLQWQPLWQQSQQSKQVLPALQTFARQDAARFCRLLAQQAYVQAKTTNQWLAWQLLRLAWHSERALQQNVSKEILIDNLYTAIHQFFCGEMPRITLSQQRGLLA